MTTPLPLSPDPFLVQLDALALKHEPLQQIIVDGDEYDHIHDYQILEQDLSRAARRTLDNLKRGRKYDNVLVLAVYWEETLTKRHHLAIDVETLLNVFHGKFGYKIDRHILKNEDAYNMLNKRLVILNNQLGSKTEDNLLVFYYGGHGGFDEGDSKARLWLPSLKDTARSIDWNKLQSQLEESDFDILFLFDCCYAMSMPNRKLKWRRRCEVVGSSGPREKVGGRSETSFTAAIADLLEDDYKQIGETNAWRLGSIMKGRDYKKALKSIPDYEAMCKDYLTIPLVPIDAKDATSDGACSASSYTLQSTLTSSDARIMFSVAATNVPKAIEFQRMLNTLSPTITDIKVRVHSQKLLNSLGLFPGNSALAFLSVPVWLWYAMPTNPAYKYIGLARSRNFLEEACCEADQQALILKYCSIGMQTEESKGESLDEKQAHLTLADSCIRLMSTFLKQDICGVGAPRTLVANIASSQMDQCLPFEVKYACLYWVQHIQKSGAQLQDNDHIHEFLQVHLLHWLEALSWIGKISDGILAISSLEAQIVADKSPNLHAIIYDAKRFALHNRSVIEQAPLQLYCSALVFAPEKSVVRRQFETYIPAWIQRKPKIQAHWSAALQTLEGHFCSVTSVAFSRDSKQVVSGSEDQTVRLWDATTGAALQTLEGHSGWVASVAFSPDGKQVVSGSEDQMVQLWDVETGIMLQTFRGHSGLVTSVAFSPNGKQVVSGSWDQTVQLWDTATGTALQTFKGHSSSVASVAFSPDGKQVVSGSDDHTVQLWDAITGNALRTLEGHSSSATSVAFSPDGKQVVSGSEDHTVQLWNAETGTALQTLKGHSSLVASVAFSPDGKQIVSGSWDQTVQLWDAETGTALQTLKGHSSSVTSVAFSPDGKQVVSGSDDQTVWLWDAATRPAPQTLKGHSSLVASVAFSPDGKQVVSGSEDQTVWLWDAETGTALWNLKGHSDSITLVAFSPDSKQVVSGSEDHTVQLWDAVTGTALQTLKGHSSLVASVAFSPDGKQIVSGSWDRTVRLWDATTGAALQTFKGHSSSVASVTFSPDGKQVVSGSWDQTVRLWDAATGTALRTLRGHSRWVTSVAFSPDGKQVVSGSDDHTVRFWDTASGTALQTLEGRSHSVSPKTFSLDSKLLPTLLVSNGWIVEEGINILWLPLDYQLSRVAVWNKSLVLGNSLGRVSIIEFIEGLKLI